MFKLDMKWKKLVYCLLLAGGYSPVVNAAASVADRFDSIWEGATLYQNPEARGLQSIALVGRYHGQYWDVESDRQQAHGWDNRRMIFGVASKFSDQYALDLQMHISDDFSPVYDGLYTASIKWSSSEKRFSAMLGRLDYVYTGLERSTSSKKIVTFERGQLVGQLMPGEVVGLYTQSKLNSLTINAGIYSGEIGDEFSDFSAGLAAGLGLSGELLLGYESGSLHLDYLYNDGDAQNTAFEPYQQIASLWHQGTRGAFSMSMDFTFGGQGLEGRPDVYGLTLIPSYDLLHDGWISGDKLQLAARYQIARSEGDNGLNIPRRYEREVVDGAGDRYQATYLGLNYLLYGDRLKLMAGAEYANMDDEADDGGDFSGWTYLAGLRLYF